MVRVCGPCTRHVARAQGEDWPCLTRAELESRSRTLSDDADVPHYHGRIPTGCAASRFHGWSTNEEGVCECSVGSGWLRWRCLRSRARGWHKRREYWKGASRRRAAHRFRTLSLRSLERTAAHEPARTACTGSRI